MRYKRGRGGEGADKFEPSENRAAVSLANNGYNYIDFTSFVLFRYGGAEPGDRTMVRKTK